MKILNGLDLVNQRIQNVGDPSSPTDATNRQYVDNVARGLSWKIPVRLAPTTNINLSSPGTSFDGKTANIGDDLLLMNQTAGPENGIYTFQGGSTALTRRADADNGTELRPGTAVTVTEGATYGDKAYQIISDAAITIGTTSMTWGQLGGGTTYTGSNGVAVSGSNITGVAAPGGGVTVGAAGFAIDTSIVSRKLSGSLGNGSLTSITVTHSLGTKDVLVGLRDATSDAFVMTDWVATDVNSVTFTFATAPAASAYRWTVEG